MSTVQGGDQINIEADVHGDDFDDDIIDDANDDGNNQDTTGTARVTGRAAGAARTAAGGTGPASFNLRVEQNKIPEFFGSKSKDTILAADFIRRLEDLAKTNRWSDAQTYYHFANSLRNPAWEWLSSAADWDDDEHEQPLWSDFKEIFKNEYAVQTNKRLILEGLANLAMKPNETTNELLTQITRTVRVIKESFENYGAITPDLHNDNNHGISNQTFQTFKQQHTAMMFNIFKMNLFKAALTPELWAVVAQQDQEQMTVKKMYMHATTAQREGKTKPPAAVNEISEDDGTTDAADEENDVAAFNRRGARPKQNQLGGQSQRGFNSGRGGYQSGAGPSRGGNSSGGSNSNWNGKFCYFCQIQGHRQEECQKRIKENKPCRDAQGRNYWPRIYFMDENPDTKAVNSIYHEDVRVRNEDSAFNIAGIQHRSRTAALPQQFLGFQLRAGWLPSSKLLASSLN
jgi:hypothetical protein